MERFSPFFVLGRLVFWVASVRFFTSSPWSVGLSGGEALAFYAAFAAWGLFYGVPRRGGFALLFWGGEALAFYGVLRRAVFASLSCGWLCWLLTWVAFGVEKGCIRDEG